MDSGGNLVYQVKVGPSLVEVVDPLENYGGWNEGATLWYEWVSGLDALLERR
jgi:hypothetical protein